MESQVFLSKELLMQKHKRISYLLYSLPVWLLAPAVQAHPAGPFHTHGLANGLLHPLTGLDHLLAMFAVGLWAVQQGGRKIWQLPLTFIVALLAGGFLGMAGIGLPRLETGIGASVLVIGLLIAAAIRLPKGWAIPLVALCALAHGLAHGLEMPANVSGLSYAAGFGLATLMLHLAGIAAGLHLQPGQRPVLVRFTGGAIALTGLFLISNL